MMLALSMLGCAEVVDAPTELDELVGFLFEHVTDEDDAALAAGAVNLDTWLIEGIEETAEGYAVNDLSAEALAAVGYDAIPDDAIDGAAVGHISIHSPNALVETATSVDNPEIYGGDYVEYERTYNTSLNAFLDKSEGETLLDGEISQIAKYAGLITVESHSQIQYRWVETEIGWVMIERTWLLEPAKIDPEDWVELDAQFFIWAVIPVADGSARTIQATWVAADMIIDLDENTALNLMIDSMGDAQETLDDYISGG